MNLLLDTLSALIILGLPVGLLSWYLTWNLSRKGELESNTSIKQKRSDIKHLKKRIKAEKAEPSNLLERRWIKFGGGFYGLTALATLILIELQELWGFIIDFPGLGNLFHDGVIAFLVRLLVNQFQNIMSAFVWFGYWSEDGRNLFVWVVVPYLAYLTGLKAADSSIKEMKEALQRLWRRHPPE